MNTSPIAAAAAFLNVSPGSILNFRADAGGLNNRNYRFEADGAAYFLRVPTPASRLFASVGNEIAIYAALAGSGIADRVVRIDPDTGIKLSIAETDVRTMDPQNGCDIAAALTALRKLHRLSVPGLRKETIFERTRRFDRIRRARKIGIDPDLRDRIETLWRLEPLLNDRPNVPVHGDALPENVLIRPDESALLIDFEFAALGDPLEDLASLYCHLPPEANSADLFLRPYLDRAPTETETYLFFAYAQLTALGWHLWAQLKIHADENVGDIERYDRRMIDYATCRTLPPIPETLLPGENRA